MTSSGPSDEEYADMVREILFAEPIRGVPNQPCRLMDHIYIGSQSNAESLKLLRSLNITHVLNCAGYKGPRPSPNASPYEGLGIDYYEFQAEDTDDYNIVKHFPEAFPFLDRVKRDGGVALVHCALGINRSGAVCLGYLMSHGRMPLLKATQHLKDRRRVVLANKHFQRLLVRYARSRGMLDHACGDSLLPSRQKNGHRGEAVTQSAVLPRTNGFIYDGLHYDKGKGIYYSNGTGGLNGYNGSIVYTSNGNGLTTNSPRLNDMCADIYSRFDRLAESLRKAATVTKQPQNGTNYHSRDAYSRSQSVLPSNRITSSYIPARDVTDDNYRGSRRSWSGGEGVRGEGGLRRSGSFRSLSGVRSAPRRPVSYIYV